MGLKSLTDNNVPSLICRCTNREDVRRGREAAASTNLSHASFLPTDLLTGRAITVKPVNVFAQEN